jgi:hypothetical protein
MNREKLRQFIRFFCISSVPTWSILGTLLIAFPIFVPQSEIQQFQEAYSRRAWLFTKPFYLCGLLLFVPILVIAFEKIIEMDSSRPENTDKENIDVDDTEQLVTADILTRFEVSSKNARPVTV